MSPDRKPRKHRASLKKSRLRARWPGKFQVHCADIAETRGLKVFERDEAAWATDGQSEWVFHRPKEPSDLWFEAWQLLCANRAAADKRP